MRTKIETITHVLISRQLISLAGFNRIAMFAKRKANQEVDWHFELEELPYALNTYCDYIDDVLFIDGNPVKIHADYSKSKDPAYLLKVYRRKSVHWE